MCHKKVYKILYVFGQGCGVPSILKHSCSFVLWSGMAGASSAKGEIKWKFETRGHVQHNNSRPDKEIWKYLLCCAELIAIF